MDDLLRPDTGQAISDDVLSSPQIHLPRASVVEVYHQDPWVPGVCPASAHLNTYSMTYTMSLETSIEVPENLLFSMVEESPTRPT